MNSSLLRTGALFAGLGALYAAGLATGVSGFSVAGHKWGGTAVSYYVNPQNTYVSEAAAISAIQSAAAGWGDQSNANIDLVYSGQTSGSTIQLNNKNEVFFRNTSSASGYVAETYWWYDASGRLVDFDIAFYEGGLRYFTGSSGCTDAGIYIDDVAIHEFGHALGIDHSTVAGATMSSFMPGYCDRSQMTLEADDIAAVESLYPPATQTPLPPSQLTAVPTPTSPTSSVTLGWIDNATTERGFRIERSSGSGKFSQIAEVAANTRTYTNVDLAADTSYSYRVYAFNDAGTSAFSNTATAQTQPSTGANTSPLVTIVNPVNNSTYPAGVSITFSGSAVDTQDGSVTSRLQWRSSIDGSIGSGGSFSRGLSAGTHTITASVTDAGGLTGSATATVVVTSSAPAPSPSPTPRPTLTVRAYKLKGVPQADLVWSGLIGSEVTVRRSGAVVATTPNDGAYTDVPERKTTTGAASTTYEVCAGSTCTNSVKVSF
jgi:hypothetical protein